MDLIIAILLLIFLSSIPKEGKAESVDHILRGEGFVLLGKYKGEDLYYNKKQVKNHNGFTFFGLTTFSRSNTNKGVRYGLTTINYVLVCEEKRILNAGKYVVPLIGKPYYKDNLKSSIKYTDFKPLNEIEKKAYMKLCKGVK